mgnify:CR=1 FL=1
MTELSNEQIRILVNMFLVCAPGAGISVCRMGVLKKSTAKGEIRAMYYAYFMFFMTSILSYLFGAPPSWFQVAMGVLVLFVLLMGFAAWANGPPAHTYKKFSQFLADMRAAATGHHMPLRSDCQDRD